MAVSSVHIELDRFFFATKDVTPDNCWEWFKSFRDTLLYKEYEQDPNPYALELLDETDSYSAYCAVVNIEGRVVAELERKGEEVTFEKVRDICVQKKGSDYIELKEREARYIELHPNASRWNGSERKGPKKQKAEQQKEQPTPKQPQQAQQAQQEQQQQAKTVPVRSEPKHPVGESSVVMLTDMEEMRLKQEYAREKLDFGTAITILESYILNNPKGKKYTSHAAVLRKGNWVWNRCMENRTTEERLRNAENSGKTFAERDRDSRTEFFSRSIFDDGPIDTQQYQGGF